MSSAESAIAQRAMQLLRGRPKHTWAAWVGLSGGAVTRLLQGSLPDPVKLSGAIRAENLSLSWLVDGAGSPYLATNCGTQDRLEAELAMLMNDEDSLQGMVVTGARDLHVVVLHQPAQVEMPGLMNLVNYTAVTILSAPATGSLNFTQDASRWTTLHQFPEAALNIASGHVSSSELFGWPAEPTGIAAARQPAMPTTVGKTRRAPRTVALDGQAPRYRFMDAIVDLSPEDQAMVQSLVDRLGGKG